MKVCIPENLDLEILFKKSPPIKTIRHFDKDFLMYLISLINSIRVSSTDGMRRDGSVPIYSAILRKLKPNYNQYMKYLFDNSIIELTKSYDYNKHTSNYYNYTSKYINSSLIEKDINNHVYKSKQKYLEAILTKNIDQISNKSGKTVFKESYKKQNEFLRHLHLEGDYESELRKSTGFKYQINKSKLETINSLKNLDIDLITHRDSSSFRFHSPLTRLKKDFRKYLRFDGDILGQVDIKNSQPFFMLALFDKKFWVNDNPIITRFLDSSISRTNKESLSKIEVYKALNNLKKDEIAKYSKSVVEGRYYEDIVQEIRTNYPDTFIGEPDRELAKALFLNSFFSHNRYNTLIDDSVPGFLIIKHPKYIIQNTFETIFNFTKLLRKHNHRRFALILQHMESYCVLDMIYDRLMKEHPEIPCFTIHDSLVSLPKYLDLIEEIARQEIESYIGYKPILKKEIWAEEIKLAS